LNIGDTIDVDMGYTTSHARNFSGYVKVIDRNAQTGLYTITAHDVMVRAIDYLVCSADPNAPFKRSNIKAEELVKQVLALASLTSYTFDATSFTFAQRYPAEVNLVTSYDYCHMIADILYWHLYADKDGVCYFVSRWPYIMPADVSYCTLHTTDMTAFATNVNEKDLRNRVVVYGYNGIYAEAKDAACPYLPAGYFKTAAVQNDIIDTQAMATAAANYNLPRYDKLTYVCQANIIGRHDIVARKCVTLDDTILGTTGLWYIYSAQHTWGSQGYTVSLELRK
jgi:hypothetical protein